MKSLTEPLLELNDILRSELKKQVSLLAILEEERQALIHVDHQKLFEIASSKEQLIDESRALEDRRNDVFAKFAESAYLTKKLDRKANIRDLLDLLPESPERAQIDKSRSDLKRVTEQVKRTNKENEQLANQAIGLLSATLSLLRGEPKSELYGKAGKMLTERAYKTISSQV
jgi:flagellar biosynthesis/type III secretory pathway chaperone